MSIWRLVKFDIGHFQIVDTMVEYTWHNNGRIIKRTRDSEGKLPTVIYKTNNTHIEYDYYTDGSQMISLESHHKDGRTHRDGDLPAHIGYHTNGNVAYEWYFVNGVAHREGDKPTYIRYFINGGVCMKEYKKHGKRHRGGGNPAYIVYNESGDITYEKYCEDGRDIREVIRNGGEIYKKAYPKQHKLS